MNNNILRREAHRPYEQLVKATPYLVLLISSTVSVTLSILGNGIFGIFSQILPLLILIGLYLARWNNRVGVKMVQVCSAIQFWMNCVICGGLILVALFTALGTASAMNSLDALAGGLVGAILAAALILLQYFFPILYFRDLQLIMKDIAGWFVGPGEDASDRFPPESRHRVNCKLVILCIIQLVINGLIAVYLLAMYSRTSMMASFGGMLLDGATGDGTGTMIMRMLFPGVSLFSILAQAAIIVKYVCVILLYKLYLNTRFHSHDKKREQPQREQPQEQREHHHEQGHQPAQQKRSVKIVLERKSPDSGRFSARMTSSMIVGRKAGEANLVISDDPAISGSHMRLFIRENKLYAEDLHSHNGIYVNGRKVDRTAQIHRGDEIRLGNSVFILTWEK